VKIDSYRLTKTYETLEDRRGYETSRDLTERPHEELRRTETSRGCRELARLMRTLEDEAYEELTGLRRAYGAGSSRA
jgi:hypothetical protein